MNGFSPQVLIQFSILYVTVPPEQPTILDKWGRLLNGTVGPHREGDDITLTCRTVGGHPEPVVRWLVNGLIVDDQYEFNAGDVIENRLVWPSVNRQHLEAIFTCQAVNTKLTEAKEAMVVLNLQCKLPKNVINYLNYKYYMIIKTTNIFKI